MVMSEILERFVKGSPVTVMARLALQRALSAEWVNSVFEKNRQQQYTRELMFCTVVDLMSVVALGQQPSLHAAAQAAEELPVSLAALYAKINHIEPQVVRALVQGSAERLIAVMQGLRAQAQPLVAGYQVQVVDGNHLPGSEKRLTALRDVRGAALPGHSLVVYDPQMDLAMDLEPCEDAYTQERRLMEAIVDRAKAGQLWLADRNFCTRPIITALQQRGARYLLREHAANCRPTAQGKRRRIGRVETGIVYEQAVQVGLDDGRTVDMRRIELELATPTEDGETLIGLLTDMPPEHLGACEAARLYRRRWTIEGMFQRLESVLHSEVRSLGYPRAALFAFGIAVVAYNVLSVLQAAIEAAHDLQAQNLQLSNYYIAGEIRATYQGMMLAVEPADWEPFDRQSSEQLTHLLLGIAAYAKPRKYRKHPRKPKTKRKPGYAPRSAVQRHVSTARILRNGGVREGP